jgi:hypothetical protein
MGEYCQEISLHYLWMEKKQHKFGIIEILL